MRINSRVKECTGKTGRRLRQASGFTLVETMIVLAIMLIASGIFFMSLQPALKDTRVTNAYNTTLMTLRRAREAAIAERRTYIVTFNNAVTPNSITMTQAATGVVITTQTLPPDILFRVEPGIPVSAATTPDHFGTGSTAIDFDQAVAGGAKNVVCFQPDGSAQDINSNSNNGVVYMARTGSLYSSRAITVWGATGRLRGYRLYPNAGGSIWRQQ
jgi:prepilin-type N-terminal cleavage/methylation domain-containing protein